MPYRFLHRRRIEFAETDMAGIMHFSNFFRFMEATEHAFFRSLALSVHPQPDAASSASGHPPFGWPRVHASADFREPLRFEEEIEIELLIEEIGSRTIRYFFQFWKNPDSPKQRALAATGRLTVVCVSFEAESHEMKAIAIPEEVREKIQAAPPELIP